MCGHGIANGAHMDPAKLAIVYACINSVIYVDEKIVSQRQSYQDNSNLTRYSNYIWHCTEQCIHKTTL